MALVVFTVTGPKFSEDADSVTGAMPVPESETVWGLLGALSVMVRAATDAAPNVTGLKVSMTVQLAPAASVGFKHVDEALME